MPTYRLDIAPLTPLPLTRSPFFSYRHDQPLPLGSLVQIPFGTRSLKGIVYASAPLPGRVPLWLKPVTSVIREGWLTSSQRLLAEHISETYFSSLGNTLKHFVFPLPKKNQFLLPPVAPPVKTRTKKHRAERLIFAEEAQLWTSLMTLLTHHVQKKVTTLVIVPDLLLLTSLSNECQIRFPNESLSLSSQLTPKQMEAHWHRIRSGTATIILGTRQALFAPFRDIGQIVYLYPEERLSYKQWDMTPQYEVEMGVAFLAAAFHAKLSCWSTSPGLLAHTPISPSTWQTVGTRRAKLSLIDRRQDGKGARLKVLAKGLEKHLATLPSKAQVLLIATERGVSGVMVCQKCHTTVRCPQCQHVLSENQAGILRCLNCRYTQSFFPQCSQCGHMHFKSYGIGTIRLERELERAFPTKSILRIDRDVLSGANNFHKLSTALAEPSGRWIIATPEIGTLLRLSNLDLVVMLEGDQALAFPDFSGEERLGIEIERLLSKLKPTGALLAQTFAPEERVWQYEQRDQAGALWSLLFEERLLFGYPPVTGMIKISPGALARSPAINLTALHKRLIEVLSAYPTIEVTPVYQPKQPGQKARPSFLIKYPAGTTLPKSLITFLRRESAHLSIDVNPLKLH